MKQKHQVQTKFVWLLLLISSCNVQEHDEVEPRQELRATTYTSLAQEPALTSVIAALKEVNTGTTQTYSGSGTASQPKLDTDKFLKVLQEDSSYVYTLGIGLADVGNFKNVVLVEVQGGYMGTVVEYVPDSSVAAEHFSGTVRRYDLQGNLLDDIQVREGQQEIKVTAGTAGTQGCVRYAGDTWECVPSGMPRESWGPNECMGGGTWTHTWNFVSIPCENDPYPGGGGYDGGPDFGDAGGTNPGFPDNGGGGTYIPRDPAYTEPRNYGGDNKKDVPIRIGILNPPAPAAVALNNLIYNKPLALYGDDIPCELVKQWIALSKFKVSQDVREKIYNVVERTWGTSNTLLGIPTSSNYVATVLDIDDAYSTIVNMDYFSVRVDKMPTVMGELQPPEYILYRMRMNLNSLVSPALATFTPLIYDRNRWQSANPVGAVVSIDMGGPDNGSVVVSKSTPTSWIFSTIKDPLNGLHPVSGNREFGYTKNADGSYTFYTKGVDRITDPFVTLGNYFTSAPGVGDDGLPMYMADRLWMSFQKGISDYINKAGGKATVVKDTHYRPDWVKVRAVRDGKAPLNTLSNDCD